MKKIGKKVLIILIYVKKKNKIIGRSPYGGSFGGIVYSKSISLKNNVIIYDLLEKYLQKKKIDELTISPVPRYYYNNNNETDIYCLANHHFEIKSIDLMNILELPPNYDLLWKENFQARSRTAIRKNAANCRIKQNCSVEEFYHVLSLDKKRRNTTPTHTLKELSFLKKNFPEQLIFDLAIFENENERAGICYFYPKKDVCLTFYMAQTDSAIGKNGLNILLAEGFKRAINQQIRIFDFGSSTIGYNIQNIGVSDFKESFGAYGGIRFTFHYKRKELK